MHNDKCLSFSEAAINHLQNSPTWPHDRQHCALLANRNVISTAGLLFYTQYMINRTITSDVISAARYGRHNRLGHQTPGYMLNFGALTAQRYCIYYTPQHFKAQWLLYVPPGCYHYVGFEASRCWTITARHFKFTNTPACHINLTNCSQRGFQHSKLNVLLTVHHSISV
jgi:hypothetical protein